MTKKSIFVVCLLAIAAASMAVAGSSYFTIGAPATVGTHKLKTGEYEVNVKKDQAAITNSDGKTFSVPVKIEQNDKKFDKTAAQIVTKNGVDTLTEIDLGGSTTKLLFSE